MRTGARNDDERARSLLRVFVHDLSSPMAAMRLAAAALRRRGSLSTLDVETLRQIEDASAEAIARVKQLLERPTLRAVASDTLEHRLADLYLVCCQVARLQTAGPSAPSVLCRAFGDPTGWWDQEALTRAVTNLVADACGHAAPDMPVSVVVTGMPHHVRLQVHSVRRTAPRPRPGRTQIAQEIFRTLGGTMTAVSTMNGGYSVTVRLPRAHEPVDR